MSLHNFFLIVRITLCLSVLLVLPVQAKINPLAGLSFYVDPSSGAKQQVQEWKEFRPDDSDLIRLIAREPQAKWFGDWNSFPKREVEAYVDAAEADGTVPLLVIYNIPFRDCDSYSAGGAVNAAAYRNFVDRVVAGVRDRLVVVIIEPDALAAASCLTQQQKTKRFELVEYAVHALKTQTPAVVYVDAGNANWISASSMAKRLKQSGIQQADGFALNVSSFYTTKRSRLYGKTLSALVGNKHFVIDTSRNGLGAAPDYAWCNPPGRGLGRAPTTDLAHSLVDALLWVKSPGESDGECNGGPAAGEWWADYALGLAKRANL
ncbi:MAG: glycoside hydrolase family 6 protein [Patescibacteria group bacterium]